MKRLSLYLFLILFTLQTPSWADDISDFQIEGMSIGDSLLDYFSEEEIKKNKKDYYKNKKMTPVEFWHHPTLNIYDILLVNFITKDKTYEIKGISGSIIYENNIVDCYKKMDEITEELKEFLKGSKYRYEEKVAKHGIDKSGKSKITSVYFYFDSRDQAQVQCYDYSDKLPQYTDHLKVGIASKEYAKFSQIAYK